MSRSTPPEVFLLTLTSLCFAFAGPHTHYFYRTVVTEWTPDLPFYTMTRTLDDITLFRYDSDNEVVERKVPWFKSPFLTLLDASLSFLSLQLYDQGLLHNISNSLGHTEGFHVLQVLEGCSLYDNGTVQGSFGYHYDGKPFMYMNMETAQFIAETPEAEKFAKRFNSNATILEGIRHYLVNTCLPHITELLSLGNCTFNRKEAPVVRLTQIPIDNDRVRLYCRAYGHYPKDIVIMWYRNGEQISEEMMERKTLPLPGIKYLTSLSFNVSSTSNDLYTCNVGHSSMPGTFTQDLRILGDSGNISSAPYSPSVGAAVAICVAIILAIVIIVFGLVSFAKSSLQ